MVAVMGGIGRFVVRFRYFIIAAWVVVTIACVLGLPSLGSVATTDNSSFLPSSAPSSHAAQLATPFQPSGGSTATLVASRADGPLTAADQVAISVLERTVAGVAHVTRVRDQGVSSDGQARKAAITLNITTSSSQGATVVNNLRDQVAASGLPSGLTVNFTGQLPTNVDNQTASKQAQRLTQSLSDLAILLMLLIVYRAALAPFVTLAPAAVALAVAGPLIAEASSLGIAVLIFMVIGGNSGIDFVLPFLMFVFLMALGSDYNILMMSRIREEAQTTTLHTAIARALNATGTTITSAGLILAATFGVAGIFGATSQLREFGTSIAIGVLLDTFLVRTLLVPSVVALLGRWNWWPSPLFRQTLPPATPTVAVSDPLGSPTAGQPLATIPATPSAPAAD